MKKLADDLKAEVVGLKEQKETVWKELNRAKKEIQTATLIKGKPLEYVGELYSEEHKGKFSTEKVGFQVVKAPMGETELLFCINKKRLGEWLKEQFGKLKQSIHYPVQQHKER